MCLGCSDPPDWQRDAPLSCRGERCKEPGRFLLDAHQLVWRFRAREADRRLVANAFRKGLVDVDCTTERKGSPHVLVCRRNQASHERRVAQRRADLADLQRLGA
jgi:hypothetical protein